jgi:WD40 repeat protein/serine/threonine protein kinase
VEPAADVVGRILGEFTLAEKIGQGAFGAVYRAMQTSLGREAVVKILAPKSGGAGATAKRRFLREARLASKLDHPYAAHIYAFGAEEDGTLWIAMELVRGTALSELLRAQGPIPLDRAVPLMERICEVVENAHEHGIVHRDLKPANIMIITRGGRLFPKLLDLGLAKIVDDAPEEALPAEEASKDVAVTQRGAYVGTPLYMAPEQWTQATVDARADQYALGCVAYECLVGRPPFVGTTMIEVARAHQSAALPALPPSIPDGIGGVIARAVAKRAPERWESVLRFATALRDAAGLGGDSPLPPVDEALRRVALDAPAPIAEAVATIEAARNPHEARDAIQRTVRVTLRWLGIIGLAGRTRGGVEAMSAGQLVAELLRELRKRDLDERDWAALIEGLVKPYAERPELHAIPELVRAVGAGLPARLARVGEEVVPTRDGLTRAYGDLASALREMTFLRDYPLVVPRARGAEIWMGARRASRPSVELVGEVPEGEGRPVLADADRRPVLVLWPLAQLASPSPGAPEELFLLEGHGRRGARLVGGAVGFERQDEQVWDYFRQSILDESLAESGPNPETTPYRGLAPFTSDDAKLYFGREREAEAFANRLKVQTLIVVAGPSGVGKSSFVQAGVVPTLPAGSSVVVIRPGSTPLATLDARLQGDEPALLVVDQFEELFTLTLDAAERERFAARLVELSRTGTRVVLTVRDDFLARAAELPSLRERVTQGLHLLTTPAHDDLLRILVEPARKAGYEFDPRGLPDRMVSDVAGRPGALALLSFTASKLWEARDRHFRRLTGAAYDAMGGVGGALARHADETLAQLPAAEQRLVREAFRHLVTAEGTRAVLTPSELRQLLGGGAAADRVIETLIHARLLVSDEERIEIIHEALVVAWPRLVEWRREDAEGSRFRDQLRVAVKAWDERGRPSGLLWRGDALADYQRWRAGYDGALTEAEEAFTGASVEEARRAKRTRRGLIVLAIAVLSIAVVWLLYLWRDARDSEAVAKQKEIESEANAREAKERMLDGYEEQGRQYFLAAEPLRGLPYLFEAWKEGRRGVALRYLLAKGRMLLSQEIAVWAHEADVWAVAFSPDGKLVASASFDGRVRVWNLTTGARVFDFAAHQPYALNVAFSPDSRWLASAGGDGKARLWDLASGKQLVELSHADRVYGLAFTADGKRLASASWDKSVRLWSLPDGRLLSTLPHAGRVESISFSQEERTLVASGAGGEVTLWDVATARALRRMQGPEGQLRAQRSSADGKRVVVTGPELAAVDVWDVTTGRKVVELSHSVATPDADIDRDGALVLTGSSDGTIHLWEVGTGRLVSQDSTSSVIRRVRFCGADRYVAASEDGSIRVYRLFDQTLVQTLVGHQESVQSIACDASGRFLVSGGFDDRVRVWDLDRIGRKTVVEADRRTDGFAMSPGSGTWARTGQHLTTEVWKLGGSAPTAVFPTEGDENQQVRFSPDGTRVATSSFAPSSAKLWSIGGSPTPVVLLGQEGGVSAAAFHPHEAMVVTAGRDGSLWFWDSTTGRKRAQMIAHDGAVTDVVFSPDGRLIASSSADGTVAIWNVATKTLAHRFRGHTALVQSVAFDGAGRRLASVGADRMVKTWEVETGRELLTLEGHARELRSVVFAGDLIVSGAFDGEVRVWDAGSGALLDTFAGASWGRIVVGLAGVGDAVYAGDGGGSVEQYPVGRLLSDDPVDWTLDCRIPHEFASGKLRKRGNVRCEETLLK